MFHILPPMHQDRSNKETVERTRSFLKLNLGQLQILKKQSNTWLQYLLHEGRLQSSSCSTNTLTSLGLGSLWKYLACEMSWQKVTVLPLHQNQTQCQRYIGVQCEIDFFTFEEVLSDFYKFITNPQHLKTKGTFFTCLNAYVHKRIHGLQKHTCIPCIAMDSKAIGAKLI